MLISNYLNKFKNLKLRVPEKHHSYTRPIEYLSEEYEELLAESMDDYYNNRTYSHEEFWSRIDDYMERTAKDFIQNRISKTS